jgi:hypothetical protein
MKAVVRKSARVSHSISASNVFNDLRFHWDKRGADHWDKLCRFVLIAPGARCAE